MGVQEWRAVALEALAAWLAEDTGRMEPRLEQGQAVAQLTAVFKSQVQAPPSEILSRMLASLLRILKRSRRITVRLTQWALCMLVCCGLDESHPTTHDQVGIIFSIPLSSSSSSSRP